MSVTQSFSEKYILKKKSDFSLFFKSAKRIDTLNIRIFYAVHKNNNNRFAFGVNKKIGNAVVRNKIKRKLIEYVMCNLNQFNKQFDLYFSCKTSIKTLSYSTLTHHLTYVLIKKDLFKQ